MAIMCEGNRFAAQGGGGGEIEVKSDECMQ